MERIGWFSPTDVAAMGDDELLPIARNPALAAVQGGNGLIEDVRFPERSGRSRGFLIRWD